MILPSRTAVRVVFVATAGLLALKEEPDSLLLLLPLLLPFTFCPLSWDPG